MSKCLSSSEFRTCLEAKSYILKIYQLTLHVLEQIFQKHYLNPFLRTPCYFLNMSSDCLWHIDKVRLLWCNFLLFFKVTWHLFQSIQLPKPKTDKFVLDAPPLSKGLQYYPSAIFIRNRINWNINIFIIFFDALKSWILH